MSIPPELEAKHCLRVGVRIPAERALADRFNNNTFAKRHIVTELSRALVERCQFHVEPCDYATQVGLTTELFVFTRDELAALIRKRYVKPATRRLPRTAAITT